MAAQNFAVKLCGILQAQTAQEITAREWKLVGQEQDGSQMLTWLSSQEENTLQHIGIYINKTKSLTILHTFKEKLNIIQASVNASRSLLVYVVKLLPTEDENVKDPLYVAYLLSLLPQTRNEPKQVEESSSKQIMVQYVYGKNPKYSPGMRDDRFLLFKHLEYMKIYRTGILCNEKDDGTEEWIFNDDLPDPQTIVKVFSWAQWDCTNQVLYYIHYRHQLQSYAEDEDVKSPCDVSPMLSALQFHADWPHETVLNIPLNLPQLPCAGGSPSGDGGSACGLYEDDPVPLRVHDCSLDLQIVCEPNGVVCICHHYLYKPLDESTSSLVLEDSVELRDTGVNFAYSITLLHHGCVVHSVVPDLPWTLAKSLRPSYTLYGDNHLLVNIPMLFTHLLDISLNHEPCCHIVLPCEEAENGPSLAPLVGWGPNAMVDLNTLDVATLNVAEKDLVATFKSSTAIENKLSIMHYLIQHEGNGDLAEELISWMCLNQKDGYGSFQRMMQEFLIGTTYAITKRSLPSSAVPLTRLLPFTQHFQFANVKTREVCVSVSQEKLWNSAVVLLAPRQRISQFSADMWTRLWELLNPHAEQKRFKCIQVLDKLRVSLHCYQPEALSRCSTPMSPTASAPSFVAAPARRSSVGSQGDMLPFFELDVCTASKQEHVIAANLRELSVHLMRESAAAAGAGGGGGFSSRSRGGGGGGGVETGVHAVATRWAAAQLDASRALCRTVCRAVAAAPLSNQHRGFNFIDELEETHALVLFKALEQYYFAADSIAFPLPQGFTSFFTYLGYRTLQFSNFLQYIHRNVFELQIDVMKAIIAGKDEPRHVSHKLRLLQLVGEGRARRALGGWPHRASVVLRARNHAATLLAGQPQRDQRHHARDTGMTSFPSGEKLSPLDTFLDLLTAKASLNELDFNLIIEATMATMHTDEAY